MNIKKRKKDHLKIIADPRSDLRMSSFSKYGLNYKSLPEIDFADVDSGCEFLGKNLSFPLFISPMTGGIGEAKVINKMLATAAEQFGVGLGLGSMRVVLENPECIDSFDVRVLAPNVPLIGNIGLVQLNYGVGIEDILKLIDLFKLDAMSLHLNPLQEALQFEGDTDFSDLLVKLKKLLSKSPVPILIKDVGVGISVDVVELLSGVGVKYIDVSGKGGTSWAYIEGERGNSDLSEPFVHEGFSTSDLLESNVLEFPQVEFIAGGGIRNGVDIFKSIALGASVATVGRPFVLAAQKDLKSVISLLEIWKKQFEICMFVTGVKSYDEVIGNRDLLVYNDR